MQSISVTVRPSADHDLTVGIPVVLRGRTDHYVSVEFNGSHYGVVQFREGGAFRPVIDGESPILDSESTLLAAVQSLATEYAREFFGLND